MKTSHKLSQIFERNESAYLKYSPDVKDIPMFHDDSAYLKKDVDFLVNYIKTGGKPFVKCGAKVGVQHQSSIEEVPVMNVVTVIADPYIDRYGVMIFNYESPFECENKRIRTAFVSEAIEL